MINRFLLPAGYLPFIAPLSIFKYYEELRRKTGAVGFEYFYMVDQNPDIINSSPIGGKIFGIHGPWTQAGSYYKFIFHPKVAFNLEKSAEKTLRFAKTVGAKYVVFHSIDIKNNFIQKLIALAKTLKLKIYLEPDMGDNTFALAKKFKLPVVFDPATVEWNGENLFAEWEKAAPFVAHVHLNEYQPKLKKDQGILKSKRYGELIKKIKASGYQGFFTFEVSPLQSRWDFVVAGLFLLASYSGLADLFPIIRKWYAGISQKNLAQSINFAKLALEGVAFKNAGEKLC